MARRLEDLSDDELYFLALTWFVYRPCLIAIVKAFSNKVELEESPILDNGDITSS